MIASKKRYVANLRRTVSRMSRASLLAAASVLTLGLSSFVTTGVVRASAPSVVCDTIINQCLNRKAGCTSTSGSCQIISYANDQDNNEYFSSQFLNKCNGYFEVTSNCPFAVGSGMNNDNYGDQIIQFPAHNTSGQTIGCVGSDSAYNAVLTTCNGSNGSGGGTGTIFVDNNQNNQGGTHTLCIYDVANTHASNDFYNYSYGSYPVTLDNVISGKQLIVDGPKCDPGDQWDVF